MANSLDVLLKRYRQELSLPWDSRRAGPQRIWFVVYDKRDERKMRYRLDDFESATRLSGHGWAHLDLTDAFASWLPSWPHHDAYFEDPDEIDRILPEFGTSVARRIEAMLTTHDANTVVAITGVGSLFGLFRASDLIQCVEASVRGRLVVFFPGEVEANNYRLLDARDGWNYLAVPITAHELGDAS